MSVINLTSHEAWTWNGKTWLRFGGVKGLFRSTKRVVMQCEGSKSQTCGYVVVITSAKWEFCFLFFFSFLTLNRSSRFPGHRLLDHCKAVHFKQWSGHDVIACNARRIQMGCLFGDFPKHPLPKSSEILVHILLLIACQKIPKCSTMQKCTCQLSRFKRQYTVYKFGTIRMITSTTLWILPHPCNIYEQDSENNLPTHSLSSSWSATSKPPHTPFHFPAVKAALLW